MKVLVFSLDFEERGGIVFPKDPYLHRLTIQFAEQELSKPINPAEYRRFWVACEVDEHDNPTRVEGLLGMVYRVDFPIFRFISGRAAKSLKDRANDYLHDQGLRGTEVFVYISDTETEDQRCPQWRDWVKAFEAKPAERYALTVK